MSKPPEKQVTWKRQRTPNPARDMARLTPEECAAVRRALNVLHVRCEIARDFRIA